MKREPDLLIWKCGMCSAIEKWGPTTNHERNYAQYLLDVRFSQTTVPVPEPFEYHQSCPMVRYEDLGEALMHVVGFTWSEET